MQHVIKAEGLVKTYGSDAGRRRVLDGVSFSLDTGEFVAIMGPSGSGKTTLLFTLSGMDHPDEGKIEFEGRELLKLSERDLADLRRKRLGFVFQQPSMLKHLNILDNIILASLRDHRGKAAELSAKALALMEKAGISDLATRDIARVSGGQLQRAGICRALMNDPAVIFGDEPTGALNSVAADGVLGILETVHAGGTAVVLVTHDARVAARAGRVVFMRDGAIIAEQKLGAEGKFGAEEKLGNREKPGTLAPSVLEARVGIVTARMRELCI